MNNSRFEKTDFLKIAYRLIFTIAMFVAVFAQASGYIPGLIARLGIEEGTNAALLKGAVYAGVMLLIFLLAFLISGFLLFSKWTKVGAAGIILIALLIMMFTKIGIERLTAACLIFMLPILTADLIREFRGQSGDYKVVFLWPFYILLFICIYLIPVSEKPVDWSGFIYVVEGVVDKGKELFGSYNLAGLDFGKGEMGFDGHSSLFKSLSQNRKEVFETGGNFSISSVYLGGKVYSDFDGKTWISYEETKNPKDSEYCKVIDTIETLSAIYDTYPYNVSDACQMGSITILLKDMKLDYVMMPPKSIVGSRSGLPTTTQYDNILFDETKKYNFEYKVTYFVLNRNGEELIRYRRNITEATWDEISRKYKPIGEEPYTYQDLLDYREYVKEVYARPLNNSDEVNKLIEEITSGADSDYEKLQTIANWLANHEYTLDIEKPDRQIASAEDYLEYFLLENPKGYCSYYATAFVLMARSIGMPARYVQGYYIPKSDSRGLKVYSNAAHAWPEVYFEGVGWITFEPTPGFASTANWGEALLSPQEYEKQHAEMEAAQADLSEQIDELENQSSQGPENVSESDQNEINEELQRQLRAEAIRKRQTIIVFVGSLVAGLVLLIIAFTIIKLVIRSVLYRKMDDTQKAYELCKRSFLIFESMGEKIVRGDTLEDYASQLAEKYGIEYVRFISIYEMLLYKSAVKVDKKDLEILTANYELIKKLVYKQSDIRTKSSLLVGILFDRKVLE